MNKNKILISIIFFTVIIIFLIIILNPSHRYSKISISENKWNSIINTRNENSKLILEDIEFNDYNLIIDESNNTLYYSIINDSKNKYNPSVSFKASDDKSKIAILLDEITDEKVQNNNEFKVMIYNDSEYRIYNLICTKLPILNISYKEDIKSKQNNIPIEIYLFDNLSNLPNKVTISSGRLKVNDNNYTFSLNMMTPGKNIRDNKISLFNMKPNSQYVLNKIDSGENFKENSIHRVVLFINSEYIGLYSLGYSKEK